MHDTPTDPASPLRIGSLFSGYGGLDLAVEHVFGGETVWFSEINEPVARVFAHHWPDAPNLGDITRISWSQVEPVDILIGGFPCQDVSTVGKRAGLAPGTRSGLWAHMGTAIEVLQPQWVVIENVRGLLSSPAIRPITEGDDNAPRNPCAATPDDTALRALEPDPWHLGDSATRPLRAAGAVLGDLADLGMDAQWIGLPASLVGAPHPRFRVFILARRATPNSARVGFVTRWGDLGQGTGEAGNDRAVAPDHRSGASRTKWIAEQERRVGDLVVASRGHLRRWGRYADAIARWEHITGRPAPALLTDATGPRPSPLFVEWLMGLPHGWATNPAYGLTATQQITALGNGVLPLQATHVLRLCDSMMPTLAPHG
ncbi:MAG TPA: DNA (cytosine-5-)-methyltransferase [Propionibacteriaceae bacterium]|nr:DNA (cytosine-5-)-methyltransferase [Propionibacteriaceae bacterium]